jgi:hypothetical protein
MARFHRRMTKLGALRLPRRPSTPLRVTLYWAIDSFEKIIDSFSARGSTLCAHSPNQGSYRLQSLLLMLAS